VSRPLIAVLGVVLVLGLFFYLHNLKKSRAAEAASREEPARPSIAGSSLPADPANSAVAVIARAQTAGFSSPGPSSTQPAALVTQTPGIGSASLTNVKQPATQRSDADSAQLGNFNPAQPKPISAPHSAVQPGDLIGARSQLNESLLSGKLSGSDADAARKSLSEISQTVVFSPKKFSDDPFGGTYDVLSGERLATIAAKNGVSWQFLARINGIDPRHLRSGTTIKVIKGPFHAVVNKSIFRMDIYLGSPGEADSIYVTSFPVGLGQDGSTPSGTWQVAAGNKIRHPKYYSPRGEGVIDADDPKNPLAGYWLGLVGLDGQAVGKTSYGIHGTIDPNSIGKQASMGCIRLRSEDIAVVFDLLVEGKSKVVVRD